MIVLSSDCNKVNTKDSVYKIVQSKEGNYCIVDDENNIYGTYSRFKNAKFAFNEFILSIKAGDSTFRFSSDESLKYL